MFAYLGAGPAIGVDSDDLRRAFLVQPCRRRLAASKVLQEFGTAFPAGEAGGDSPRLEWLRDGRRRDVRVEAHQPGGGGLPEP